jgi:hypothetical protein
MLAASIRVTDASGGQNMSARERAAGRGHRKRLRCARCGDAIGIYEPLIVVAADGTRQASCAAEPDLMRARGEVFHRACHASG